MVGCSSSETETADSAGVSTDTSQTVEMDGPPPMLDDEQGHCGHDHAAHGPHGGELVELGREAYHIEMTHDSGAVTLSMLDGSVSEPVAITAKALTVSLKHEGKVKLKAAY